MQNSELVFTINTTRDYFIDWLAEKTFLRDKPDFKKTLRKFAPGGRFSGTLRMIDINPDEAQRIVINDLEGVTGKVIFEISTIGQNRIEVSAKFTDDAFPSFSSILLTIAKTYSEAAATISHFLAGQMPPTKVGVVIKKQPINNQTPQPIVGDVGNETIPPVSEKRQHRHFSIVAVCLIAFCIGILFCLALLGIFGHCLGC